MRTTIDRAGRVVVPKHVRDAMGLTHGGRVDLTYEDGRITIEVPPAELEVVVEDGLPAIHSIDADAAPLEPGTVRDTVEAVRDERDAGLV